MTSDRIDNTRESFEYISSEGSGGYLSSLAKLMVPGDGQVIEHLLATARLSPKKARSVAVLLNSHFRSSKKPAKYPKSSIDWWSMNDGARLALLVATLSVSIEGKGRSEISSVLGAVTKFLGRGGKTSNGDSEGYE